MRVLNSGSHAPPCLYRASDAYLSPVSIHSPAIHHLLLIDTRSHAISMSVPAQNISKWFETKPPSCTINGKTYVFTHGAVYSKAGKKYPFPLGVSQLRDDMEKSISHTVHVLSTDGNCVSVTYTGKQPGTIGSIPNVIRVDLCTNEHPVTYKPVIREVAYREYYNGKLVSKLYLMNHGETLIPVVGNRIKTELDDEIPNMMGHDFVTTIAQAEEAMHVSAFKFTDHPVQLEIEFEPAVDMKDNKVKSITFMGRPIPAPILFTRRDVATQVEAEGPEVAGRVAKRACAEPVPSPVASKKPSPVEPQEEPSPAEPIVFTYGVERGVKLQLGYEPSFHMGPQRFEIFEVLLTDGPNETPRTIKKIPLYSQALLQCIGELKDFRHSITRSKVYFNIPQPFRLLGETGVARLEFKYRPSSVAGAGGPA